ncbi:MAG: hypothetical protein ABIY51_06125 [Ferruginibacter sp.]
MKQFLLLLPLASLQLSAQNVGVNVTNPTATFEIKGNTNVNANALMIKTNAGDTVLQVQNSSIIVAGSKTSTFGQLRILNDGKTEPHLKLFGLNSTGNSGRFHSDLRFSNEDESQFWSVHSLIYGPDAGALNLRKNNSLNFNTDSLTGVFKLTGNGRASFNNASNIGFLNITGDWQNDPSPYNLTPHINMTGTGVGERSYITFSNAAASHYWRILGSHSPGNPLNSAFHIGMDEEIEPRFTISGNGDVIIGNGTSGGKLTVNQTAGQTTPTLYLNNFSDAANPSTLQFRNGVGTTSWLMKGFTDQANNVNSRLKFTNSVSGDALSISGDGKVGIGTLAPSEQLEINGRVKITGGTPGAGKVLTSDAVGVGTWSLVPGTIAYSNFAQGFVITPTATPAFISATAGFVITSSSQKVVIMAQVAMGSTLGATGLDIFPAYKLSTGVLNNIGSGIFGLTVAANQRTVFSISGTVTGLAPGSYSFGMSGSSSSANWNNNEFSYVTIMVIN